MQTIHAVFICFVPNMGTCLIILSVLVGMHGTQDRTTPDHVLEIAHWVSSHT